MTKRSATFARYTMPYNPYKDTYTLVRTSTYKHIP